jgi:hypothetical protein
MDAVDVPDEMPTSALPDGGLLQAPASHPPRQLATPDSLGGPAGGVATPRRRRSRVAALRRFALFMLILAGTGFGVMMWVDPVFRQKTVDWCRNSYAKLHAYATAEDIKAGHAGPVSNSKDDKSAKDDLDVPMPPPSTPSAPSVADVKTPPPAPEEPAPKPVETRTPVKAPEPAAQAVAPAPPPAAKPTPVSPAPAAPVPAGPGAPPAPPEADPIPATYEEQLTRARQLYKQGRAAEFKNPPDYAAALKAYSAIKKLSKDVWQNDLESCLERVKNRQK